MIKYYAQAAASVIKSARGHSLMSSAEDKEGCTLQVFMVPEGPTAVTAVQNVQHAKLLPESYL